MTCRFSCDAPCFREILDRLKRIEDELMGEVTVNSRSTNCGGSAETKQFTGTPLKVIRESVANLSDAEDDRHIENCGTGDLLDTIMAAIEAILNALNGGNSEGEEEEGANLLLRIYMILGGNIWFSNPRSNSPRLLVNPESFVESRRLGIFPQDESSSRAREVISLLDLIGHLDAVDRHRSGQYRLPAEVPADVTDPESENDKKIYSVLEFQEWIFRQIDAISGAYPLKIQYKNADGDESEIIFQNQAEALAELMGVLLNVSADAEILTQLGIKGISETIKTQAIAIKASDHAIANAEFLGYRIKERKRDLPLTITPGKDNLLDALKESRMKITRHEYDDSDQLPDYLKRLLMGSEIIRAVFMRRIEDFLPGEFMGEEGAAQRESADDAWTDFLNSIRDRGGVSRNPNAPIPEIRTTTEDRDASR